MIFRRDFCRTSATALAAAAFPWHPGLSMGRDTLDRIGIQLYTLRTEMASNFERTLERVAAIGYQEVEFAGLYDRTPEEVKSVLERVGLKTPSGHLPYEAVKDPEAWRGALDTANRLGHQYVVIAWTPAEDRRTLEDWKRVAERFNRAARQARNAGLEFAYHNHDFEFHSLGAGPVPFDLLLAETDPALVRIELDLYWITLGGHDPMQYFRRYPGRFPMVHVKDMKKGGDRPQMVDVGQGDIDFGAILAHRKEAGIRHFFVEHDQPADPLASAARSYQYLKGLSV